MPALPEIHEGPRFKSDATRDLETIIKTLLHEDDKNPITMQINKDEIHVFINNQFYNLTDILENNPDFEQFIFSDEDLAAYVEFIQNDAKQKPRLSGSPAIPLPEDFKDSHHQLDYAEKLAINLYTSSFYKKINPLLRSAGRNKSLTLPELKEILLCAAIASHGLTKPLAQAQDQATLYRKEKSGPMAQVIEDRKNKEGKSLLQDKAFHSSASDPTAFTADANFDVLITIEPLPGTNTSQLNSLGKDASALSMFSSEKETLYPPGTQFAYQSIQDPDPDVKHRFVAHAVRSIDEQDPFSYRPKDQNLRQALLTLIPELETLDLKKPKLIGRKRFKTKQIHLEQMIAILKEVIASVEQKKMINPECLKDILLLSENINKKCKGERVIKTINQVNSAIRQHQLYTEAKIRPLSSIVLENLTELSQKLHKTEKSIPQKLMSLFSEKTKAKRICLKNILRDLDNIINDLNQNQQIDQEIVSKKLNAILKNAEKIDPKITSKFANTLEQLKIFINYYSSEMKTKIKP